MRRFLLVSACFFLGPGLSAQGPATDGLSRIAKLPPAFRHELLLTTENDTYTLTRRDGYYTNGIMIRFSRARFRPAWAGGSQGPVSKVVQGYELGQQIFNPVRYDSVHVAGQDRPFAGYLYGKFDQQFFLGHRHWLQWSLALGVIGRHSYAAQVQNWYHNAVNIYPVKGWSNQVQDEVSLNLGAQYAGSLLKSPPASRSFDVATTAAASLGNAFTHFSGGLLLRMGTLANFDQSAHWGGRVSAHRAEPIEGLTEAYFYLHPTLTWQAYNATLQGGYFREEKGPKTATLQPWYLTTQIGFCVAPRRWTLRMHLTTQSRQVKHQIRNEQFVSIRVGYRFG